MWNGYCGELIRRLNQRLLMAILVVGAGLLAFFGYNLGYFNGFFTGPHSATAIEMLSASKAGIFRNAIVTIDGGTTTSAGLREYTKDDAHPGGYVSARYLITEIGGSKLLVRVDPNLPLALGAANGTAPSQAAATFTGQLHAFSSKTAAIVNTANQSGGNYLLYYLDTYDYRTFGWISSVIGGIALLWAILAAVQYVKRNASPANHPFAKELARYGALEALIPQVDAAMSGAATSFKHRGNTASVAGSWYVVTAPFMARAVPLTAILWAFRKIVKRRIYFVIPAGTQQSLVTYGRFGNRVVVQLKQSQIDDLLLLLRSVAPQALYGYSKPVLKLWLAASRNPDRSAFSTEARALLAGQTLPDAMTTSRFN